MNGLLGWKSGSGRPRVWHALAAVTAVSLLVIALVTATGAGHRVVARPTAAVAAGRSGFPVGGDRLFPAAGDPVVNSLMPGLLTATQQWPAPTATAGQPTASARLRLTAAYGQTSVRLLGSHWSGSLELGAVGRGDQLVPVSGRLRRRADGARYGGAGVVEMFAAVPTGIEQSFTVNRRPAGSGPLVIRSGLAGLLASGSGGALVLRSAIRTVGLYSGLRVTDAAGHVIRARMRPAAGGRAIVIDVADKHARYPLRIDPTIGQIAEVDDPASNGGDEFGYSVAVSGSTAVVGAPGANQAYVYTIGTGAWTQTAVLTDPGSAASDEFGDSVAISGNTVVVGAPNSPYFTATPSPGAAYVYTLSSGGVPGSPVTLTPSDGASNDGFGISVATSGGTVVVGAQYKDSPAGFGGAVYVYGPAGAGWQQTGELTPADSNSDDQMGASVGISESGSTIVAGGYDEARGIGSAYIFTPSDGFWTQAQMLTVPDPTSSSSLPASVAISGSTIVVGGSEYAGQAYVYTPAGYTPAGPTWTQAATLDPDNGGGFVGRSLAISGNTIVLGAFGQNLGNGNNQGAAYVFTGAGSSWTQQPTDLTAADGAPSDSFGWSVAVSGTEMVSGAYGHAGDGAVYLFAPEIQTGPSFTVTTAQDTNDGACYVGNCSLRDAITAADAYVPDGSSATTIAFDIPGQGAQTIQLATPLPAVTAAMTIDATTQPGYAGSPVVVLDGQAAAPGTLTGGGADGEGISPDVRSASSSCPGGSVVTGLQASQEEQGQQGGNAGYVSQVAVICTSTGGDTVTVGATIGDGSVATSTPLNCSGTDVGLGIYGNAGDIIDGVGIRCGSVGSIAADGPSVADGGGTSQGAFDCPLGSELTGLTGTFEDYYGADDVLSLTPVCTTAGGDGLDIVDTSQTTVRGLAIVGFAGNGITISGGGGNAIEQDWIGLNPIGAFDGNGQNGIAIVGSHGNQIGGSGPSGSLVIAGNGDADAGDDGADILISGSASSGNVVQGSWIGLGADGVSPADDRNGVLLDAGATDNTIGGSSSVGNVIYGLYAEGVYVTLAGSGNVISGNTIGANASGSLGSFSGASIGITVENSPGTTIGDDATPGTQANTANGNEIVGQTGDAGIFINSPDTTVAGNLIGTNSGAATGLGNAYGIYVASGSGNVIGPGNTVADNTGDGVSVNDDGTQITGNSISGNAAGVATNGDAATPVLSASSAVTGSTTALNATVTGSVGAQVAVEFFASPACDGAGSGEGATYLGSSTATIGAGGSGTVSVASALPTSGEVITATATTTLPGESSPSTSEFSSCSNVVSVDDNTTWPNAQLISLSTSGAGSATASIDLSGEARWYKVPIAPGGSVQLDLSNLPADYDLALFSDISQAQASLTAGSTSQLQTLSTELPGSSFSPSEFSPSEFSPSEFSPSEFSPSEFSPSEFSPSEFSPSEFSPSEFSPSEFSPSEFSPSVISPSEFSPSEFSPSEFSPSEFSPSTTVSDEQDYEDAQIQSLLAVSNNGGDADQTISADTWNNTGYFYIRVTGANGAYDPGANFSLGVQVNAGTCGGVQPSSASLLSPGFTVPGSSYKTLILTDESRMTDDGELSQMESDLSTFAGLSSVDGTIVDVGADSPQVAALQAQAKANPDCPYAENLVADSIRNVVLAVRDANPSLEYVVIIGDDQVIPFFRYPDTAGIGPESGYVPPVLNTSPSFASLESNDFLSQDAYGASTLLNEDGVQVPVPDLPVGRLVETPTEIDGMLQAYMSLTGGVVAKPSSSLVTGYDFMTAGADAVESDFSAGLGSGARNDTLITNDGVAPSDTGLPPDHSWTASQLETALLSQRHDLIYLGGHFSANNTLAADYTTTMNAQQLASSNVNLENSIVLSAGCHAGYNIVSGDAVPGVTQTLDWVGAFAQKQATLIAGTGYQYGDTDFLAYSDQLYADFSHALRYGSGPVAIGSALVNAKSTYLDANPNVQGIDLKSILETTLYGLPMLSVNLPAGRIPQPTSSSTVSSPTPVSSEPGSELGLSSTDLTLSPTLTPTTTQLQSLTGGSAPTATYLSGPNGVESSPAEPTLPLADSNVSVAGEVLRGVGFRGGTYTDHSGITPLTGAPTTELSGVHSTFSSSSFFPSDLWTVNYFGGLTGGSAGTQLMLTPAQYESDSPGSLTDTQRSYSSVGLRLFYSDDTSSSGANTPALAAPPTISQVSATTTNGTVTFQAHVVGDPSAGIQQVWVTYTGITTPASGTGEWQSLDLTQDATDSTLWTGTLSGLSPSQIAALPALRFIVQAANGVGLVGLDDNDGSYYALGQIIGGLASQALPSTTLALNSPPSSGGYGSSVPVSATLTSGGSPVSGALVNFTIGGATAQGQTNADGVAQAQIQLTGAPGSNYQLIVSYDGSATEAGTSVTAPFTVNQVATTLALGGQTSALFGTATGITASLNSGGLDQPGYSVAFVLTPTGGGSAIVQTAITALNGIATLGVVPGLAPGGYSVQAFFGPGAPVALPADPILLPSHTGSSTFNVTGQPPAIQSANATTFTIGAAGTFKVSSTGIPTNALTNANFGSCTRSSALPTGVSFTDNGNNTATLAGTPASGTAGTYTLCLNASNGDGSATQQFTLTVVRATPTIPTISNLPASGTYGGSFTATVATNGDGAKSVTSATPTMCTVNTAGRVSFVGVGLCKLTAQLAQGATYAAAQGSVQTITVAAAPLKITASSTTMTFGASVPTITASYLSFVNGDTAASLKTLPSCKTTATSSSAPGSYPTSCSGAVDPNYSISYASGSLTVTQAAPTLTYSGPQTASTKSTFVPAATLSAGPSACESGQPVGFTLNVNPITGAAGPYTLETATTNSSGVATGAAISTAQWQYGSYTLTLTYAGNTDCAGSIVTAPLTVVQSCLAATGYGILTVPGAGSVGFGFVAGLKPGTKSTYTGALVLVNNLRWQLIASVTAYSKSGTTGVLSGTGSLYWWNPTLNHSMGAWILAASNVAYTATTTSTSSSSPGSFGISIVYKPVPGQPTPLPNSAPIALTKGAIGLG